MALTANPFPCIMVDNMDYEVGRRNKRLYNVVDLKGGFHSVRADMLIKYKPLDKRGKQYGNHKIKEGR